MQKKDNGNTESSIVIDACIVTEHVTKVLIPEKVSSLHTCQYEYVKHKFLEVKKHKEEELLKAQQLAREEGIKLAKKCIASEMGCDEKELDDLDLSELNEFSFDDNEPLTSFKKIKLENETSAGTPQYVGTLKKPVDFDENLGQTSAMEHDKEPSVQETEMGARSQNGTKSFVKKEVTEMDSDSRIQGRSEISTDELKDDEHVASFEAQAEKIVKSPELLSEVFKLVHVQTDVSCNLIHPKNMKQEVR